MPVLVRFLIFLSMTKSAAAAQWCNQVHFTGGATREQVLFKGGQQLNDIISDDVISGVARNFKRGEGAIISTFFRAHGGMLPRKKF